MNQMKRLGGVVIAGVLALAGCSGSDGTAGAPGAPGIDGRDLVNSAQPEACGGCHPTAGANHQAVYNTYTDATAYTLAIDAVETVATVSKMTFTITKDGVGYVDPKLAGLEQKTFYAVNYDRATRKFNKNFSFSNPTSLGGGQYSVASTVSLPFDPAAAGTDAVVYMYIADNKIASEGMQLYSDVVNIGRTFGTIDYVSTANVAGCEKCHGAPYRKHGYRMATVAGLPDFVACKNCHYDTRTGNDQGWQLLADDPLAFANQNGVATAAQKTLYAYKASIMNDVHMSHAMEFAYPQSMANCVTCHEGKLGSILTPANFTLATCKSCHPVTGPTDTGKRAPGLKQILVAAGHSASVTDHLYDGTAPACTGCHNGTAAPNFNAIHKGYDQKIYAAEASRYADVFPVTIDDASFSTTSVLTIKFSATEVGGAGADPLDVGSISPTVMVGLYGWDTKDFLVSPHGKDAAGKRLLEWTVGTSNPRFMKVSGANGSWEVRAYLTDWAPLIADGKVKRAEIAIMPALKNADGVTVALNAPSRTFDLVAKKFDDGHFAQIVDPTKCNKCHDALGTTFHSGDRGGNVAVCRLCHTTMTGAGHLEMQSRSIDSFVHAIHSFQAQGFADVDFLDSVQKLEYEHHVESTFPNFTILNCESCHNPGMYEVPHQSKSMPGIFSASDTNATVTRAIGGVPSYVAGPGSRACGSCHRADAIAEDNAPALEMLNAHTKSFGYLLEEVGGVLDATVEKMMALFK